MNTQRPQNPFRNVPWVRVASFVSMLFLFAFTMSSHGQSLIFNKIWSIAPGSRPYVTSGSTERGIAISPLNNNVFIVSRAPTLLPVAIYVLDGETGQELLNATNGPLKLSTNNIAGGSIVL